MDRSGILMAEERKRAARAAQSASALHSFLVCDNYIAPRSAQLEHLIDFFSY